MGKYLLYAVCGCLLILNACNNGEDDLEPSYADKNWFQVEDKPGELNQLLYQIYTDTGMPIFVNDTLGEENFATTMAGNPMHRVETFNLSYILFGTMGDQLRDTIYTRYVVHSQDTANMIFAAELLRDKVIPELPKVGEGRPMCFFLVDSLKEFEYVKKTFLSPPINSFIEAPMYVATKGVVLGGIDRLDEMTDEELDIWCGRAIGAKAVAWISEYVNLELWYAITTEGSYGFAYSTGYTVPSPQLDYDIEEGAGWFAWRYHYVGDFEQYLSCSEQADVMEYVARIYAFRGREDEFLSRYDPESKVYRKFVMMKNIVDTFEENVNW